MRAPPSSAADGGLLTWHVAFERGRTPWGHVLAFAFDGRSWIVIDPHMRWTEVFTLPAGAPFDAWVSALDAEVWRLAGRAEAPLFAGFGCVGVVKKLVGLRSGAFTPAGLRRDLVRQGAKQVFREVQSPQGRSFGRRRA